MNREEVRAYVNQYCKLRDVQFAAYELHAKKIIPPAASAEIDAMAELAGEDIIELVRITTLFSNYMKKHFNEIREEK